MTPEQTIRRAGQAQSLLDNPLFKEVMDGLEKDAVSRWMNTGWLNTEDRENAYHAVRAVRDLRSALQRYVSDGQLARAQP